MSSALHAGDCRELMATLPENSVDAIVTDPPYGLGFMGKQWDIPGSMAGNVANMTSGPGGGLNYNGGSNSRGYANNDPVAFQAWSESWAREAYRVLKPGGHLLAFGGSRTYHRLACAVEDAGFEIRDQLQWLYGSGFPKSLDVSKAMDKAAGAEREVVGTKLGQPGYSENKAPRGIVTGGAIRWGDEHFDSLDVAPEAARTFYEKFQVGHMDVTAPATDLARQWDGWGTALKPAHEPIVLARKPLIGTVSRNVSEHGTGALNIDGCRIEGTVQSAAGSPGFGVERADGYERGTGREYQSLGRWPANVILGHSPECREVGVKRVKTSDPRRADGTVNASWGTKGIYGGASSDGMDKPRYADPDGYETVTAWECAPDCAVALLDAQSGERPSRPAKSGLKGRQGGAKFNGKYNNGERYENTAEQFGGYQGDTGGASRFFYCAKSSRAERNAGLEGMPERASRRYGDRGAGPLPQQTPQADVNHQNHHPTVKPIAVMRWLVRLITPPGGTVLDPFMGSGTTGIAAAREGFDFIGIEQDAEYLAIAERRIAYWRNVRQSSSTQGVLL